MGGAPRCGVALKTVYGLAIDADLDLPELTPAPAGVLPHVTIRQGAVAPAPDTDPPDLSTYVDGAAGRLWLNIPDILRMSVTNGDRITYRSNAQSQDTEALRLFLLGSGLGALLMQRDYVVIHGNAIVPEQGHGAILCVGPSGAGKSTIAIAMLQKGLQVLADDVCPVSADGQVQPGMARAKLWQETADRLSIDTTSLSPIMGRVSKFNLPLGAAHCTTPKRIRAVFVLDPSNVAQVSITPVTGTARFVALRSNVYRPEYLRPLGIEAAYLARLAALAAKTPVFRVTRPKDGFDIDRLVGAILDCTDALPATTMKDLK